MPLEKKTVPRCRSTGLTPETIELGNVWWRAKKALESYDEKTRSERERLKAIERQHAQRYMDAVAKEGCRVIC